MALRANYVVSTSSNVDISARLRAYQLDVTSNAEQGSVAMSRLEVDDPEGGINITGFRKISLTESAESSNQTRIYDGFTADRDISRGGEDTSFRTGSARQWSVNMADANSIITRRIMRGSDADRPAETDLQRIAWLLTTTEFGNTVTTSRYVSTTGGIAMDAVDYRDQSNQQILDDCSQASGKNFFVFYDEPVNAFGLFYDFASSSVYRSTLRLTNILGYVDNDTTFAVSERETRLNRDPSRVYSGVILPFVGGEVYVQNAATGTAFFHRDTLAPSVNVKTTAKATARANRYIADNATEADVITTSFLVPLNKVNHLMQGMAVQVRFAHLPGYDQGWNWVRVLNRQVVATSEEYYTITVELASSTNGGAVDPIPLQSCTALNGGSYFYTQAGTRTGIGPPVLVGGNYTYTSTDFLHYWRTGQSASDYPLAGQVGDWGNGGVNGCVFNTGGIDYNAGGTSVFVRITVIGPGSLVISTSPHPGGMFGSCGTSGIVSTSAFRSGTGFIVASDSKTAGTNLNLTIPVDGFCAHYVEVTSAGPWGFVSATWTPA